jgi:hypothetical protein
MGPQPPSIVPGRGGVLGEGAEVRGVTPSAPPRPKPGLAPAPFGGAAGTDSRGPMDPPNIRLRGNG